MDVKVDNENGPLPFCRKLHDIGEDGDQASLLIPRIPDEITVTNIATKLHWKDMYSLACVSQSWKVAIKSRQIFEARCASQSTQTLFAYHRKCVQRELPPADFFPHSFRSNLRDFVLYSPENNAHYDLPSSPSMEYRWPHCESIFLDGSLYVFGESIQRPTQSNVYVYDLVTQEAWKPCARAPMDWHNSHMQCAVLKGKIYVFDDGLVDDKEHQEAIRYAVYDPQHDAWSPCAFQILHTGLPKIPQGAISLGDDIILYGAPIFNSEIEDHGLDRRVYDSEDFEELLLSADIYHPETNEWRTVKNFRRHEWDVITTIDNKVHRIDERSVDMYDVETDTWSSTGPFFKGQLNLDSQVGLFLYYDYARLVDCVPVNNNFFFTIFTESAPSTEFFIDRELLFTDLYNPYFDDTDHVDLVSCPRRKPEQGDCIAAGEMALDVPHERKWELFLGLFKCPVKL